MELRNSVESLKTLLDVSSTSSKQPASSTRATASDLSAKGDSATVSSAGSEISQVASLSEIRSDKVAAIQAAIASGTYHVPASAVATKVVDSMLSSGQSSEN